MPDDNKPFDDAWDKTFGIDRSGEMKQQAGSMSFWDRMRCRVFNLHGQTRLRSARFSEGSDDALYVIDCVRCGRVLDEF